MPTIENDIVIDRPPEQAWMILGDLTAVTRWVPGVAAARHGRDEADLHPRGGR